MLAKHGTFETMETQCPTNWVGINIDDFPISILYKGIAIVDYMLSQPWKINFMALIMLLFWTFTDDDMVCLLDRQSSDQSIYR